MAIALLENTFVLDRFGREKTEGAVLEYRGVALRLVVIPVLVIPENDNTRLGAVRLAVLVELDLENAHGRENSRNETLTLQREVLLLGDALEHPVLLEPPFFFGVQVEPNFTIRIGWMNGLDE